MISTHTSLAGRDLIFTPEGFKLHDFYSHVPRGTRPLFLVRQRLFSLFLLTRPSRDATYLATLDGAIVGISTHTSLAGRDAAEACDE